jgi:hypothetical protein
MCHRVAIDQLNIILLMCTASFLSQVSLETPKVPTQWNPWERKSTTQTSTFVRVMMRNPHLRLLIDRCAIRWQLAALVFNLIQLKAYHRLLVPPIVIWAFGSWFPSTLWTLACLYLTRKTRRASFSTGGLPASAYTHSSDYVRVLLEEGGEGEDIVDILGAGGDEEAGGDSLDDGRLESCGENGHQPRLQASQQGSPSNSVS